MIPATRRSQHPDRAMRQPRAAAGGFRETLGELFPLAPQAPVRTRGARVLSVVVQVAAVGVAAALMLLRVPGLPSWRTIDGEDYFQFLTGAIQQPWHLSAYAGYVQVLPRIIAQVVSYLPLAVASAGFALAGAIIGACCALIIFHASAGHIQSVKLRALLAAALVLLSAAPMEIIDNGMDTVWYLMPALFWAMLWRPRTRAGMTVAAVVAFITAASNVLAVVLVPLLAVRLYVLRRPREHAVSAGWLAGCLMQVPFVVSSAVQGDDTRLTNRHATPGQSLAFYGHDVVLPSLGWHLSWWLRSFAGITGATAIAAVLLAVIFGVILLTQPGARPFVVTALVTGFIFTVVCVTDNGTPTIDPVLPADEPGSRYTILPLFLIVCAVIVGVGNALPRREHGRPWPGLKPAMAVTALVVFLAATWTVDFRYAGVRSQTSWNWAPIAAKWERDCAHSPTGEITERFQVRYQTLPCRNITR